MAAYGRVTLNRGGRNSRFDCIYLIVMESVGFSSAASSWFGTNSNGSLPAAPPLSNHLKAFLDSWIVAPKDPSMATSSRYPSITKHLPKAFHQFTFLYLNIEYKNLSCEGGIEKSLPRITTWHHEACRVMTNGNHEGHIFLSHPHGNNELFFLLTTKYFISYWKKHEKDFQRILYMLRCDMEMSF